MDAIDRMSGALQKLLQAMDEEQRLQQYEAIVDLLDRENLLDEIPSRDSPKAFASQLFSPNRNHQLARRVMMLGGTGPVPADNPLDLLLDLLPSDGHLE